MDLNNLATEIRAVIEANVPQPGDTGLTTAVPMALSNASTIDTNGNAADFSGSLSGDGALTKTGDGTLTLSTANTYSGPTTIQSGTLFISASPQATSAIEIASGATLGLDISSPVAAVNASVILGGTVLVTGTPVAGNYTLLAASSITGTPVLAAAIPGYQLQIVGDNELRLVQAVVNPYETWAGGGAFNDDTSGDGIANGLAWLLGAANPNLNATALLPTINESDGDVMLTFSMLNAASRGAATLNVEYSKNLEIWTTVPIPDTAGETVVVHVTFNIAPGDPLNTVTATISSAAADGGGKIFGRLMTEP